MLIIVIDGQGGGIGKSIIERVRNEFHDKVEILALGTNALATSAMLRAGANEGVTGENAVICNVINADIILGALSIILPNSMNGELSSKMAKKIMESKARKILLPLHRCNLDIVGLHSEPLPHLVDSLVTQLRYYIYQGQNKN